MGDLEGAPVVQGHPKRLLGHSNTIHEEEEEEEEDG